MIDPHTVGVRLALSGGMAIGMDRMRVMPAWRGRLVGRWPAAAIGFARLQAGGRALSVQLGPTALLEAGHGATSVESSGEPRPRGRPEAVGSNVIHRCAGLRNGTSISIGAIAARATPNGRSLPIAVRGSEFSPTLTDSFVRSIVRLPSSAGVVHGAAANRFSETYARSAVAVPLVYDQVSCRQQQTYPLPTAPRQSSRSPAAGRLGIHPALRRTLYGPTPAQSPRDARNVFPSISALGPLALPSTRQPLSLGAQPSTAPYSAASDSTGNAASPAPNRDARSGPTAGLVASTSINSNGSGTVGSGVISIDGAYMGRWLEHKLTRSVSRPQHGITGVDGRLTPTWPGAASP